MRTYYAHTPPMNYCDRDNKMLWQLLSDHLKNVSELTSKFAIKFKIPNIGKLCGMFHDFGKYYELFQKRLEDPIEYKHINHWTLGAFLNQKLPPVAFSIEGHHIDLPDCSNLKKELINIKSIDTDSISQIGLSDLNIEYDKEFDKCYFEFEYLKGLSSFEKFCLTKLLFSSLIDADRLDTEEYGDKFKYFKTFHLYKNIPLNPKKVYNSVWDYIEKVRGNSKAASFVNKIRDMLIEDCIKASSENKNLFTLTAPTGSGKTTASLFFASNHAHIYNKERIIYVAPYTSILDQTYKTFLDIFKGYEPGYLHLHHSNFSLEELNQEEVSSYYLSSSNWNNPFILTTSVQFFESLFSNNKSMCRKLHNICNSVIIIDEIQTFPIKHVFPMIQFLNFLASKCNCTIMLMSATHPHFHNLEIFKNVKNFPNINEIVEIARDPEMYVDSTKRIDIVYRDAYISKEDLACELSTHHQAICIVNTKKDACELYNLLKKNVNDGVYHLSTLMYAGHRLSTINKIKSELKLGNRCILISTQLIEAGVDVSFPVGYRVLCPYDGIAQSGGRVRRNGEGDITRTLYIIKLSTTNKMAPSYASYTKTTEAFLAESKYKVNYLSPNTYKKYYDFLFSVKTVDEDKIKKVHNECEKFNFETVSDDFKMISNGATVNVIVNPGNVIGKFISNLSSKKKMTHVQERFLNNYSVNLFQNKLKEANDKGLVKKITIDSESLYMWTGKYDDNLGIRFEVDLDDFVV